MNSKRTARPTRRTGITSAASCAMTSCNGISRRMPFARTACSSSRRGGSTSPIHDSSPAAGAGKPAANGLITRRRASPRAVCASSNTANSRCVRALTHGSEAGRRSGRWARRPASAGPPAARWTSWNFTPMWFSPTSPTVSAGRRNGLPPENPSPNSAAKHGRKNSTSGRWTGTKIK